MVDDPTIDELTALLADLRSGSPDAVTRVHGLTVDLLEAIARGIVGDNATAQDVVQEVFLRLIASRQRLRATDGRELRAWLVTVTRNACRDELRRRSRHHEDPVADVPETPDPDQDPASAADQFNEDLRAGLARLPEPQRAVLVLRHVAGLDGRELGRALGRSRGAAYALLARAERSLRSTLAEPSNPDVASRHQSEGLGDPA